jgi:hypothetical protein
MEFPNGPYSLFVDLDTSYDLEECARAILMRAVDAKDAPDWVQIPREDLFWLARAITEQRSYVNGVLDGKNG